MSHPCNLLVSSFAVGWSLAILPRKKVSTMTFIWFVIWVIANNIGDNEALTFDPVNLWAGTLLLTIALDLGRQHATAFPRS